MKGEGFVRAEDDVIEKRDFHEVTGVFDFSRDLAVVGAWCGVAGGVVVGDEDSGGIEL